MAQTYPDLDMYPDPDMDMSEILDVLLSEVYELYNQEPDVPAMNDAQTCPDPELGLSETEVYDLEQELAARGLPVAPAIPTAYAAPSGMLPTPGPPAQGAW